MRVDQVDSGSTTLAQTEPEKWELNGVKQWTSLNAEKPADPPVSLDVKKQKEILERHKDSPPSFVLHIFPTHFKFEKQDGVFLFSSSMKNFLDYLNKQRIPPDLVDVFDEAQCQYYEGCIIAEIHDYREIHLADIHASNANTHRVLLTPNAETLWSDLCLLNEKCDSFWSEDFTLEVESKILLATEEPLCLDPSFQVTRISNTMCNYGNIRKVKKRKKRISVEKETESAEKAEKEKTMMMMDERYQREFQPTFGRLSFVQDWRKRKTMADAEPSQGLVTKKLKNRQIIEPLPPTHDNKQIVRTLRFAKEAGGHTLYTIINIYLDGNTSEFDGLLRIGAAPNTSINGNTMKFHIGSKSTLQMYIENAKRIFEIDHKLISDDSLIAFSSPAPSPSLQASTQEQQPEPTSSQSPHLLSHVQNPLLMLAQTQPIARTLPQAIPSVQQPPQPAPLPQPPIQISPTQPQTTPSLPAQLPTQLPSHLDSSSSQPQHSPLQAHLFQAQQASASPPVGGNLQTPAILPGNITPANTNGIPSTSTSSATPQDALSLSLQQFAQSKGMKNLTPQQLNQLKQQLIRKKQLMMQRALQQQQQQRQQAQQTQQQSPLLSVPSPQTQQQQFSPSQQQLQSPHQQHSQLSSPIQFSQNSSPMLQRQEMGQSPSISNQQMSISPQQHQQSPPQPSLSVAQASLQFRTSPLQPPPPQQMLQVRPTGNVPHQMTSPNGQPVNLPNGMTPQMFALNQRNQLLWQQQLLQQQMAAHNMGMNHGNPSGTSIPMQVRNPNLALSQGRGMLPLMRGSGRGTPQNQLPNQGPSQFGS